MPKALFFPSYLGGGFGHIGRCLALATALEERGWQTSFALGGQHAGRLHRSGRQVHILRRPGSSAARSRSAAGVERAPVYTLLSDLNYQLVRDGLHRPSIIRACVAEQLGVIRREQPDLLIADTWPLAGVVAHLSGLPLVQIARAIIHPQGPGLLWWQPQPEGLVSPDPRPVFNPLLKGWGIPPIERAEDLLTGNLYLIPSLPELDPLPDNLPNTYYIGPLVYKADEREPEWLLELDASRPVIYITTGGGAGLMGGSHFFSVLFEALQESELQIIVSAGTGLSLDALPSPPSNFQIAAWVPGPAVIARSSLVVFPGGYGTSMELVQAGVPGLVIPFHSEQESNARRLEALGVARVLLPSQSAPVQIWRRWPGGRFTILVHPESDLTPASLRQAILSTFANAGLKLNARQLQTLAAGYRGAAQGVELIEALHAAHPKAGRSGGVHLSWWQKHLKISRRL